MPSSQEILGGLDAIANGWRTLAILWHLAFATGLIALAVGWRPTRPLAGVALAVPLASVSVLAWVSGNPFNGTTFALIAATLAGVARTLPQGPLRMSPSWLVVSGVLLAVFGLTYPHFLETEAWVTYLYAAPLGLIPCPTLSAVVGVALMVRGLDSRAWSLILAGGGVAYGLIGWLRLGVLIDAVLLIGATTLAVAAVFGFGARSAAGRMDGN